MTAFSLAWRRDGNGWVLLAGRRRFGRVLPEPNHAGMWRSAKTFGRLSDLSNLSHAKNAVLVAAEVELEWEDGQRRAIDPLFTGHSRAVFRAPSSLVRQNPQAGVRHRKPKRVAP